MAVSDETSMTKRTKRKSKFSWRWVLARMSVAFLLVFLTYNPTGYSYMHWLIQFDDSLLSLKISVGIFLFILLQILFNTTFSVFRLSGLIVGVITAVLLSHYVLLFVFSGERLETFDGFVLWLGYLLPMTVAFVIGAGTSWPQMITLLSGQEYKRLLGRP
jgi:hypothetical protein